MSGRKRGSVAVVGAAESDLGLVAPLTSPVDLMAQATMRALDDCGLKLADVDALFVAATQVRMGPMALAEYLRIKPKYFDGTTIGGSSFMSHVTHELRSPMTSIRGYLDLMLNGAAGPVSDAQADYLSIIKNSAAKTSACRVRIQSPSRVQWRSGDSRSSA